MTGSRTEKKRSSGGAASRRASSNKSASSEDHDGDTTEVGRADSAGEEAPASSSPAGASHNSSQGSPAASQDGSTAAEPTATPSAAAPRSSSQDTDGDWDPYVSQNGPRPATLPRAPTPAPPSRSPSPPGDWSPPSPQGTLSPSPNPPANASPPPNTGAPPNPPSDPSGSSSGPPANLSSPPIPPRPYNLGFTYPANFTPDFWNELTRVFCSRRARGELDRRNQTRPYPVYKRPDIRPKSLARFAMHGGPDIRFLRNCPRPGSGRGSRNLSVESHVRDIVHEDLLALKDDNWDQHLRDHNIHMHLDAPKTVLPENINIIRTALAAPIAGFTITPDAHTDFADAARQAYGPLVLESVIPCISHSPMKAEGLQFVNLKPLTGDPDARAAIVPAPCAFDGVPVRDIDATFMEDQALDKMIRTTHGPAALALPNFVLEAMGANTEYVEKQRATYHGAVGARAMHTMQNYGLNAPVFDGCAYAFSATYVHEPVVLTIYAHHMTAPTVNSNGLPVYHMTRIDSYSLRRDPATFIRGTTAFRNARDLAEKWRDEAVARVNALGVVSEDDSS